MNVQTDATLMTNNFQHYWMLHVASVCTLCNCMLLHVVALSLKPVKLLAKCKRTQQFPTMLGNVCQQCCVCLRGALAIKLSYYPEELCSPRRVLEV